MGVDAQKLSQILARGGASADTLKHRLKAQIAWTTLVRGRLTRLINPASAMPIRCAAASPAALMA
jgi:hypothetical protein